MDFIDFVPLAEAKRALDIAYYIADEDGCRGDIVLRDRDRELVSYALMVAVLVSGHAHLVNGLPVLRG